MEPTMTEPNSPEPTRLSYATPAPPNATPDPLLRFFRRFVFAVGCGLVAGGIAYAFSSADRDMIGTLVGIGGGLIALAVPLPSKRI
jgi:hypothetical protein